jgi:hypothetical protein
MAVEGYWNGSIPAWVLPGNTTGTLQEYSGDILLYEHSLSTL